MIVNSVSSANVGAVAQCCEPKKMSQTHLLEQEAPKDSVSFSGRSENMTDLEKKELILKARTTAAGWSAFGGVFSTMYYALRSDDKVAKRYDLDPVEDKALVKKIKKEQTLWTVSGVIGIGCLAWLYNKAVADAEDIDL